jgi:CubicO group peptidase (beta-lactamase class C family)
VTAGRPRSPPPRRVLLRGGLAAALVCGAGYAGANVARGAVPAAPGGFRPGGIESVDAVLEGAVAARAFPGAALAVGRRGAPPLLRAFGRLSYEPGAPEVATDTIYDLASLTKVVVTTTLAMVLVDEGALDLEDHVSAHVPAFAGPGKDRVSVRQLLAHSGGLSWWAPLYRELEGEAEYVARIGAMDLAYEPGTRSVYSDLGVILVGRVIERVGGASLAALARDRVLAPLGMNDTGYLPGPQLLSRIAPTEVDPWRGRLLRGEVHDENAFALGGVAPHAGLFGTAPDLARVAQLLLDGGVWGGERLVSAATVELFTTRAGVAGSTRALGWDTPTDESGARSSTPGRPGYSSAGSLFSARSFGHTGFTGTSMWMDPARELYVILLTNRVHPTRDNDRIREVRSRVADAAVRALDRP